MHFHVDADMKIRLYGSDSPMLRVACSLCAHTDECDDATKASGLLAPCAVPCG